MVSEGMDDPVSGGLITDVVELKSFVTDSKALNYILCKIIFNVVIYTFIY